MKKRVLPMVMLLWFLTPLVDKLRGGREGEPSMVRAEEAALPKKEAVSRHVQEYLSSIQSIHVHFQHWTTQWPDEKKHTGECGPQPMEWAEQGNLKLLRQGNFPETGLPPMLSFISFDGRQGFYVDYIPGSATEVRSMHQTPQINESYQALKCFTPVVFYGHRFPYLDGSLIEFIDSPETAVVGFEKIDGVSCVHLQTRRIRGTGGIELAGDVWLDRDMDWLPRRISMRFLESNSQIAPRFRGVERRYEVAQFVDVNDSLLQKVRKFPGVMKHVSPEGTWRLNATEVHINSQLSESVFRPAMAKGTLVYDGDQAPFTPVKTFIVGGGDAVTQAIDQRVKSASDLRPPTGSSAVDARVDKSFDWSFVTGIVSTAVLIGVVIRLWISGKG